MGRTYQCASGARMVAGRPLPTAAMSPVATGGTITMLARNWLGRGFQLLTTFPANPFAGASCILGHAGCAWDDDRQILWLQGSHDSHVAADMDNAIYRWDAATGLMSRQYTSDPYPGGYCVASDGMPYADAAHTRPWACHGYRRHRFLKESAEFEHVYDVWAHYMLTSETYEAPAHTAQDTGAIHRYNVTTGVYTFDRTGATSSFVTTPGYVDSTFANATCYVPGFGWVLICGTKSYSLTDPGRVFTIYNTYGKTTDSIHNHAFWHAGTQCVIKFGGGDLVNLCAHHPISDLANGSKKAKALFSALTGWSWANGAADMGPDGKIYFTAQDGNGTGTNIGMFAYDPQTVTVTDTGHRISSGITGTSSLYDWRMSWAPSLGCMLYLCMRQGTTYKLYGYRP